MLAAVRASSVDDLFAEIPEAVRRREPLALPAGLSEAEVVAELRRLAGKDVPATQLVSFLGAGVYDHYVPAVVDAVVSRGEFLTAYTPYQPERSQGVLQTIFEYQTAICELTGMDVSNASMYDGGTALAEASILAGVQTRRGEVVLSAGVHPEYRQVLETESAGYGPRPQTVGSAGGRGHRPGRARRRRRRRTRRRSSSSSRTSSARSRTCPPSPSWRTQPARSSSWSPTRSRSGCSRRPAGSAPTSSSARPRRSATRMNFGGPGLGYMAVTTKLMRRIPGRLVGETVDLEGRRGFVLTLQTREQHIRREKATSNICSNHALNALATLVYLSWLGKEGLPELGAHCARKAAYLRRAPAGAARRGGLHRGARLPRVRRAAAAAGGRRSVDALVPEGFLAGVPAGRFAAQYAGLLPGAADAAATRRPRRRPARRRHREAHPRRARRLRRRARPRPPERGGGPWLIAASAPVCRPPAIDRATIYEKSSPGRRAFTLPELGVPEVAAGRARPRGAAAHARRRACPRSARSTCCATSPASRRSTTASTAAATRWARAR